LSYPNHLYTDKEGESTTWHRPVDAAPDIIYPTGNTAHYLITGARSGGLVGMYRWNMGPEQTGADVHFHRSFSESFFVLSGSVRVFSGSEWVDTQPGDFVHAPPGGLHGFRNESGEPASMLILFAPGAPREAYFEGLLGLSEFTEEERVDFMTYHDNHWADIE
jgi:mannose-6-phosphate isomerase-like protein (cupin superfamily)